MSTRIVITGIGVVSPIGCSKKTFWQSCMEGRSGTRHLESPWVTDTDLATRIAAPVVDFDPSIAGLQPKQLRVLDRTAQFAIGAAQEALNDAGFELVDRGGRNGEVTVTGVDPMRFSSIIGSGIGGLTSMEITHAQWVEARSKKSIKRFSLPMLIPNSPSAQVAIRFGARGECKAISTACAAGTMALGDACRLLSAGHTDVAIAGGAEGVAGDHDAYALMGFERLQTLSTRNDQPEKASRPFDRDRDGFVLGEGACLLVLEREGQALARGAKPYAALSGYAANCDAKSMMQLDETGESIVALIDAALAHAAVDPGAVNYVSAHGTSTRLNDKTEATALRRFFGKRCDDIAVTALKSMTGHGIAASGPMEAAAAALSFREGILTPTINYENPDPECDVDVVGNLPRRVQPEVCLKLSYGFGGHNACLVMTRI